MSVGGRLYIGIDLGTFNSVIASSSGVLEACFTVIGKAKDIVAAQFLGSDTIFGEEALKNRLALNIYRPLEAGVLKDDPENRDSAKEFLAHLISMVKPEDYDEVYGVICAPSEVSFVDQQSVMEAARGSLDAVMVVSEPFAVAFELDRLQGSIVIDIGAGTTDVCRVFGRFPEPGDQKTIHEAGDWLDNLLLDSIKSRYAGAQITKDMVRLWKEKFSFVGEIDDRVVTEFSITGKKQKLDITKQMHESCEQLVPKVVNTFKQVLAEADPEYQGLLRDNVILAGGGSQIRNLDERLKEELKDVGSIDIFVVDNPEFLVAKGALKLAQVMPDDQFTLVE